MKGNIDIRNLLETAGTDIDFTDGNRNRIWDNATKGRGKTLKPKLKWLIPTVAAVMVLFTLGAVPQARAAVFGLFGNLFDIMDYINMDQPSRPENTAVSALVQNEISTKVSVRPAAPGTSSDWIKNVNVQIDEVLYDGQNITIKYSIFGKGIDGFIDYPTQAVHFKRCDPLSLELSDSMSIPYRPIESWSSFREPVKADDGIWKAVAQYGYSNIKLSGIVNVKFTLQLQDFTGIGDRVTGTPAGFVEADFNFNASAGSASMRSIHIDDQPHALSGVVIATQKHFDTQANTFYAVNRETPLDGCSFQALSATQSPVETKVMVRFVPSNEFLDLNLLKNELPNDFVIELLNGDKVVGEMLSNKPNEFGGFDGELTAPLLSTDIRRLTVRVTFQYVSALDDQLLQLNKSVAFNAFRYDHNFQTAECVVPGGTFDIDLTQ